MIDLAPYVVNEINSSGHRVASPFRKGGLRGISTFSAFQIPPTPLFQRGSINVLKIVQRDEAK
jgi:hypothetical protein